jgi:hypothetical protein
MMAVPGSRTPTTATNVSSGQVSTTKDRQVRGGFRVHSVMGLMSRSMLSTALKSP